jgi:fibronectin type 3 domain-containing protein
LKLDADNVVWGEYSKVIITATKPSKPTVKVTSTSTGKANLSWSNVSGESGYQVYYSTQKDNEFKKVDSFKSNTIKSSKSNLKSGKTYYFKVRAYKKVDGKTIYGSFSSAKSVKIK